MGKSAKDNVVLCRFEKKTKAIAWWLSKDCKPQQLTFFLQCEFLSCTLFCLGMGLYYENRKAELQETVSKVSEDDTNQAVLGDLQQKQEGEFLAVTEDLAHKVRLPLHLVLSATQYC